MHRNTAIMQQLAASPNGMLSKNIPSSRTKRPVVGGALTDESDRFKYSLQSELCRVKIA